MFSNSSGSMTYGAVQRGPQDPAGWSKAVRRPTPAHFTVELLSPVKTREGHVFALKITPVVDDMMSASAAVSNRAAKPYTIWRAWEDLLWLQEWLEIEYEKRARMKRRRLEAGKGTKKKAGLYKHVEKAASFESLPAGPDPKSIAVDVHQYIPALTKKGALFRETPQLVKDRQHQIKQFLPSLLGPNLPVLLCEIQDSPEVADFFSYWERDYERTRKLERAKLAAERTPSRKGTGDSGSLSSGQTGQSLSSKFFSSYFSRKSSVGDASTASLSLGSDTTPHGSPRQSRSDLSSEVSYVDNTFSTYSGSSSSSDSSGSPPASPRSMQTSEPHIHKDERHQSDIKTVDDWEQERQRAYIESLPPVSAFKMTLSEMTEEEEAQERSLRRLSWQTTTSASTMLPDEYLAQLGEFSDEPTTPGYNQSHTLQRRDSTSSFATMMTECSANAIIPRDRSANRLSWQTTTSASSALPCEYTDNLVYCDEPTTPGPYGGHFPRDSIESFATMMTDCSANAISPVVDRFAHRPASLCLSIESNGTDLINNYFDDEQTRPVSWVSEERCPTPVLGDIPSSMSVPGAEHLPSFLQPRTPRTPQSARTTSTIETPISPISPISPTHSTISVKAIHNSSIIKFRVSGTISFVEMRKMLSNKFCEYGDESKLSQSFAMAWLPQPADDKDDARDSGLMRFIQDESEWKALTAHSNGKLTLRAIGDDAV